jgi:hypothetical protein
VRDVIMVPTIRRWLALFVGLVVVVCALLVSSMAVAQPSARSAGTIALSDSASLHLTGHHGFTLNEAGTATGTISGRIYIHLTVTSTNRVSAEVNLYPSDGSVTGYATASYRPSGALATFNGTMSVARGSGRYNHASGSGLSFSGSVRRTNDAVTVHVNGRMST